MPTTPEPTKGFVPIRKISDFLLDSAWRESGVVQPGTPDWEMLRRCIERKILDLYCLLKFRKTYEELWSEGDDGILKLVGLLKVPNGRFNERYQKALAERDYDFLRRYREQIQTECFLDTRTLQNRAGLRAKHFLYLNWEYPFLTPELDHGLLILSNRQICDLLGSLKEPVFWDENQLKRELHKLRLKRTSELRRVVALARLSSLPKVL